MEAFTTIKQMLAGNKIFVPTYQRAYSWDTELVKTNSPRQINEFLSDLENHTNSMTKSKYYFGHFLFEEKDEKKFGIIDGQQRMTTIVIFLSALFSRLKQIRPLNENEQEVYEDIIKRNSTYRFETVDYDDRFFKDFVIDQTKKARNGIETVSANRIAVAFDFFTAHLSGKDETYLLKMLDSVQNATCTTHPVKDPSEAIQMFIFQNNRGKKPSNLEIIKAQFMFYAHLYGLEEKESLIKEIKDRFEKIYKSISSIEYRIREDDVLVYTMRVHFNSLWETNEIDKINKLLSEANPILFIKSFSQALEESFEHLTTFFGRDESDNLQIHSLVTLGGIGIALPFIIKAYKFALPIDQINLLCSKLETLVLRHKLIGTRAEITSRLNDVYQKFTYEHPEIKLIIERIDWMKTTQEWWWSYWGNAELERSMQGGINHVTARYLLWKYENYLESQDEKGYKVKRFDEIVSPELEHIAPQTENPEKGYDNYDEEFVQKYLNCLGNYLLISKSHNSWASNRPFLEKRNSYTQLAQQREIQELTLEGVSWTRGHILNRKEKIIKFVIENL